MCLSAQRTPSKINRIFDRFGIATADIGSARTEIVKAQEEQKNADIPVPDRNTTEKDKEEAFLDALLLPLRPIRRRHKRKTPRKARLQIPSVRAYIKSARENRQGYL